MLLRSFLLGAAAVLFAASADAAPLHGDVPLGGYYSHYAWYAAPGFYPGYEGYRHSWTEYPYGLYDYGMNVYGSAPTTMHYSPYYAPEGGAITWPDIPSPAADLTNSAFIRVRVPHGGELWFDGAAVQQQGSERAFVSPPLRPGQDYTYEIHARWMEDGRTVEHSRTLHVHANSFSDVDMTQP